MVTRLMLLPILLSAGALLGANGGLGTLTAMRAGLEGFPEWIIGLIGSSFFMGFLVGSLSSAALIRRSGHIRVFAAFSATAAIAVLAMMTVVDPWVWMVARLALGIAFSVAATVVESWLNALAESSDRGRVLSVYRIVDLAAVTGVQFLIPALGVGGIAIFVAMAVMYCAAVVPVALSKLVSPPPPESSRIHLGAVWAISPVACAGCITLGLTNGAFRQMGPLYAQGMGLDADGVALFMTLGIAVGLITQYPLGWLSDRFDRRWTIVVATIGATIGCGVLSLSGVDGVYLGILLFGAFAVPLYSLSAAHANDFAGPGQYIEIAAGLMLFFALGAIIGPSLSAVVMERFGVSAFFMYIGIVHILFLVFVVWRMTRRAAPDRALRSRFVALLRTSPVFSRLAGGNGDRER
ncbi:MAG: MFS transporter [Alphaproteobacteria bacterium]|nr:MFS transporter [Alphaproteobacteria bacterium]